MAGASAGLHEEAAQLKPETIDRHRAMVSRARSSLRSASAWTILAHNRDEEKEHACMVLEWLRRRDPAFAGELRTYLFTEGGITELEDGEDDAAPAGPADDGSLGIGSLKGESGQ